MKFVKKINQTLKPFVFFTFALLLLSSYNRPKCPTNPPQPTKKTSCSPKNLPMMKCIDPMTPDPCRPLKLVELLEIALNNNPLTSEAWANAKAAAAVIGQQEANYWPTLEGTLTAQRQGDTGFSGLGAFFETEYSAQIALTWILLDFGTIDYQVCSAIASFKAAKWTYDWTLQTVLLSVYQAYFNYLTSEALYEAALITLQQALVAENATVVGHASGVNTITDVLQAKAFRVNAQMNVQTQYSAMVIDHGTLANVIGTIPDACFSVEKLPKNFKIEEVCRNVDQLMCQAKYARADLAAQRATVQAFRATLYSQEAAFWPNFTATGFYQKAYLVHQTLDESFDVALNLNIPLFSGFSQVEIIRQAKAELMSQRAQLRQLELQAFLDVYTAYYTVKNAAAILIYAYEYLKYAAAAYDAIFLGYRYGTQSFTDVEVALVTLQNARASLIQAQTGWFISLAQLGYSLGCLSPCPTKSCS